MEINWQDIDALQPIGNGSFGVVYKAEYLGTEVAVKEFTSINTTQDAFDYKKYIDREVEILRECRHPNVVQFMGVAFNNEKLHVVTEFIPSGNLREYMESNPDASWRTRISFAEDAARAIIYLHNLNIIHRDLKSENLLVTENKRIKVCDFGFSRILPSSLSNEEKKRLSFCGTDAFMAPEIILCIPFDKSADIFSLGVILLELVLSQSADLKQGSGSQEIHVTNDFFTRVIPGFGLDLEKITNAAPSECPFEFLELARDCVDDNPKNRPSIKEVLKRLRKIEQELIKFNDDKANIGVLSESDLKLKFAFSMVDIHSETNSVASSAITSPMSPSPKAMTNNMERSVSTDTDVPLSDFANLDSKNPRPHRFSLIFVLASGKCKVCSQGFRLASRHLVCDDCGAQIHKRCGLSVDVMCKGRDLSRSLDRSISGGVNNRKKSAI